MMKRRIGSMVAAFGLPLLFMGAAVPVTLEGSRASMVRQNQIAQANDYRFVQTREDLARFLEEGWLVEVEGGEHYTTELVTYPYVRPELRIFIERLGRQYLDATGEALVVTSATRPEAEQPPNASDFSVHPAGMAFDLRVPRDPEAREWLEQTLIELEREGVLDVTRERYPPHYHVAVFPDEYRQYAAARLVEGADWETAREWQERMALQEAMETPVESGVGMLLGIGLLFALGAAGQRRDRI